MPTPDRTAVPVLEKYLVALTELAASGPRPGIQGSSRCRVMADPLPERIVRTTRRSELRELEHKPKEPVDLPLAVGLFTKRLDDGAADADLQPLPLRGCGRTGEPARGHATPRGGRRVGIGDHVDVGHQK